MYQEKQHKIVILIPVSRTNLLISQQSNNFRFGKVLINFPTINQIIQTVSSTHLHKHEFTILENLKCKNTKSICILCLCKSCIYRCIHFLNTCKYLAGEYILCSNTAPFCEMILTDLQYWILYSYQILLKCTSTYVDTLSANVMKQYRYMLSCQYFFHSF